MLQTMMIRNAFLLIIGLATIVGCSSDGSEDFHLGPGDGATGIGGSTARFTISGDHLYVVDHTHMKLLDIADPEDPVFKADIDLGRGIETIFSYKENLFIGGQSGMQIYDISDEANPRYLSEFVHQTACDPVIANDNYAYVTIREGVSCNTIMSVNRLITVDIRDLTNPVEVDIDEMINPRGLTFFKGDLYVAEGIHGLKRFNIGNPADPKLDTFYTDIAANDMIGLSNTMIITRDEGIYQFGCQQDSLLLFSTLK